MWCEMMLLAGKRSKSFRSIGAWTFEMKLDEVLVSLKGLHHLYQDKYTARDRPLG